MKPVSGSAEERTGRLTNIGRKYGVVTVSTNSLQGPVGSQTPSGSTCCNGDREFCPQTIFLSILTLTGMSGRAVASRVKKSGCNLRYIIGELNLCC